MPVPEAGAVSLQLYPHDEIDDAVAVVAEPRAQAAVGLPAGPARP